MVVGYAGLSGGPPDHQQDAIDPEYPVRVERLAFDRR
jgi:hypothetical protein